MARGKPRFRSTIPNDAAKPITLTLNYLRNGGPGCFVVTISVT